MKKPKTTSEKPVSTTKNEQTVAAKATKPAPKKTSSGQSSQKNPEAVAPKTKAGQPKATTITEATANKPNPKSLAPEKIQAVAPKTATATSELTIYEHIGLTAGSIWHYLSKNGATPVTKLVAALTEEEKIIQRSIGWLAKEDKITIVTVDRIETIALNE